jgi:hypothetical protein
MEEIHEEIHGAGIRMVEDDEGSRSQTAWCDVNGRRQRFAGIVPTYPLTRVTLITSTASSAMRLYGKSTIMSCGEYFPYGQSCRRPRHGMSDEPWAQRGTGVKRNVYRMFSITYFR